jgi:hypothetical protein
MKSYHIIKKKRLIILLCLSLMAVIFGGYTFLSRQDGAVRKTALAAFDLDALLREHPNWGRYQELLHDLERISNNWEIEPSRPDLSASSSQFKLAPVDRQMIELQNNYRLEETYKWGSVQKALQDYQKRKLQDLEERFKIKFEALKKVLNIDLEAKHKEQQEALDAHRKKLDEEQYSTLANLQLRLATLGVSRSSTDEEERARIQKEINRIKDEIEEKMEMRAGQYEQEFGIYQRLRSQQLNVQLKELEVKADLEIKADLRRYQEKLSAEFQAWRVRRQQEMNKSLEKRRQEQAQQQLLFSQQTQLYEGMMRDIRKAVKEYAQHNQIGCVIAGQASSGQPDLTRQLAQMLK